MERIDPVADVLDELVGNVLMHTAGAEIGRVHARAARPLIKHHQLFALFKAPEWRGERADIHRLRGDVEEVVQNAADLGEEHADKLAPDRNVNADQPFHGQRERVFLVHRRDIVEPVEIRHGLQIGLVLDQLFGAAMQQADVRIDPLDHLAIELQNEAQNAVSRRMLRAEVDVEVADGVFSHDAWPLRGQSE